MTCGAVRDHVTGHAAQLLTLTAEVKGEQTGWHPRTLDDKEQRVVERLMEELEHASIGDYHSQGISSDWLKLMGPGVDMLGPEQVREVWDRLIAAETRTYYFGDLAGLYSHQKQIVTFLSLFLSSGAVATMLAKMTSWIPVVLSLIVALANAYSLVFNLDSKMRTMAELNQSWSEIACGYERIWQNPYTDESESLYKQLDDKERDLSMIAATEAPNDQKRMAKWQDRVLELRNLKETGRVERL